MGSATFYPNTVSQSDGSGYKVYREFNNLSNIKKLDGVAKTGLIASSTGTHRRPSTIKCTNFKISIPTGAMITKITVQYAQQKDDYGGGIPAIPAPTITLLNVSGKSDKGATPTTKMESKSISWSFNPATSKITSSSFGVTINYPENNNKSPGYLAVKYVRIVVTYKDPSYTVSISKAESGSKSVEDTINLNVGIKSNGVDYNPGVTIELDSGVSYNSKVSGNGSFTKSGSNLKWNAGLSSSNKSRTAVIKLNLTSAGSKTITIYESIGGKSKKKTVTFTVNEKTVDIIITDDESEETINNEGTVSIFDPNAPTVLLESYVNYVCCIKLDVGDYTLNDFGAIYIKSSSNLDVLDNVYGLFEDEEPYTSEDVKATLIANNEAQFSPSYFSVRGDEIYFFLGSTIPLSTTLQISIISANPNEWDDIYNGKFIINFKPKEDDLSLPILSMIKIDGEELNRLGDGYTYVVKSFLKLITSEEYVRDWYNNFRMGVFNNVIAENVTTTYETDEEDNIIQEIVTDTTDYSNLTIGEIYKNTSIWSDVLTSINTFESKTITFNYDENYPLYILFVGDYMEGSPVSSYLEFSNPIIVQKDYFEEMNPNNQSIFPTPIKATLIDDGEISELQLDSFQVSNSIVLYNLETEELQTNQNFSVLGVQLNLTVDFSDDIIILAKLINSDNKPGERSIKLTKTEEDNIITIGGPYDLWGFKIEDMVNLNEWELEISFNYPWKLENDEDKSEINIENIELVFFTRNIEDNVIICKVNGADTRHYGLFLESVEIPPGLKTDVKYLDVDGSDQKGAYRQNIDKKEITLKFSVTGCTLQETTELLKLLGKLFTNDRNILNEPIPNMLEFSHYPNEFWNVILEDPIDTDVDVVDYEGTVKLIVPDGTSYSKTEKVTGVVGTNSSIAKVNPLIVLSGFTSNNIEISEEFSKQNMIIDYDNINSKIKAKIGDEFLFDDIMELNCSTRELILKRYKSTDEDDDEIIISDAVDWNSNWFSLFDEYSFKAKGAIIQTITYLERW